MINVTLTIRLTHLLTSADQAFGSHLGKFCSTVFSTFPLVREVDIGDIAWPRGDTKISLLVLKHVVLVSPANE